MDSFYHAIQLVCVYAIPLIFAITLHESAHGWAASKCGDPTAVRMGRVTLNPIPHIDPVGTIAIPGALLLMSAFTGGGGLLFGWAKPVPINPWNFRNLRQGMLLTAIAGPGSNAIQMIIWALLLKLCVAVGIYDKFVLSVCSAGISVNLMLMAFNLIPIPPLDGSKVLFVFLPDKAVEFFYRYQMYFFIGLFVLLYVGILNTPINWLSNQILDFISWLASLPYMPFVG